MHSIFSPGPILRRTFSGVREPAYWKSLLADATRSPLPVETYLPVHRELPQRILQIYSAWKGIESILPDLINRFGIGSSRCLEFGVERGYSTAALSCFFDSVTGVDIFVGDSHTRHYQDLYAETSQRLEPYANIQLVRSDYRDWIAADDSFYDLIHVDIVHSYTDTFACGLWSAQHAKCVIFHDTVSYPTVKRAVMDIARQTGKRFYNFKECNGLGILV